MIRAGTQSLAGRKAQGHSPSGDCLLCVPIHIKLFCGIMEPFRQILRILDGAKKQRALRDGVDYPFIHARGC